MRDERSRRARRAILQALAAQAEPLGASRLAREISASGVLLQPRSIRFHLNRLDAEGFTRTVSRRRGRVLTERGRRAAARETPPHKTVFVAARVDNLAYRMTFDWRTGAGKLVVNAAEIAEADLPRAVVCMETTIRAGLGMGTHLLFARGGDTVAGRPVPEDRVVLGTVCSVAVNGILLREGIPVTSRFGGLVEMRDGVPVRFGHLIEYRGTTIDPLEAFVQGRMTSVRECARTGSGMIGASFREVPSSAVQDLRRVARALKRHDLPGVLLMGRPNQPLLEIPVSDGHTGLLVIAGLNPIAALFESGVRVQIQSLAGLEDYARFVSHRELSLRARRESPLID